MADCPTPQPPAPLENKNMVSLYDTASIRFNTTVSLPITGTDSVIPGLISLCCEHHFVTISHTYPVAIYALLAHIALFGSGSTVAASSVCCRLRTPTSTPSMRYGCRLGANEAVNLCRLERVLYIDPRKSHTAPASILLMWRYTPWHGLRC